ncbi:MAG: SAM-dependent methyltransferase [Actinomycetes bacterium]
MDEVRVRPIATVRGGRSDLADDHWGDVEADLVLAQWVPDGALSGLDGFSHLEVIFLFDRVEEDREPAPTRRPRGLDELPEVGILAQRHKDRPGRIGLSRCAIVEVERRSIRVRGLDALDGTPVVEIKPWFRAFGPRGAIREPSWVRTITADYFSSGPSV